MVAKSKILSVTEPDYWCFISYRHADNKDQDRDWASWLHQEIERYDVPAELVGTKNKRGDTLPDRIYPVFRDEESLPADADLGGSVEAALDRSRFLTVLCSPRAVESQYVAQEIEHFKKSGKTNRIIAAILAGEPGDSETECFPVPLREIVSEKGIVSEPIAADFRLRDGGEGFTSAEAYRLQLADHSKREAKKRADAYESQLQLMKLKIIAGILGVPLEQLRNRDKAFELELAKKRARTLRLWLAAVGLLALVAIAGGIFAVQQKRIATLERDHARTARAAADKVISTMVYEMSDALAKAGLSSFKEEINEVARDYFQTFPPDAISDKVIREGAVALDNSVDNFLLLGRAEEALELAEESVRLKEDLFLRNPQNDVYHRDLFVGHEKLGKVKNALQGPHAALDHFQKRFELSLALYQEESTAQTISDLALGYSFLGDVKLDLDGPAAALPDYQEYLTLSTELHQMRPDSQSTLSLTSSHLSMGDVLHPLEGAEAALPHYLEMSQFAEKLVAAEPNNAIHLSYLRLSHERCGTVKMELEGPEAALPYFQQRLSISDEAYEKEPSASNAREMAISHFKMGDVQFKLARTEVAFSHYERMFELIKDLARNEPSAKNQRWLMLSHSRLGKAKLELEGPAAALIHYQASFDICEASYQKGPTADNTRSLFIASQKLGDMQLDLENPDAALIHYQRQLELSNGLHQKDPSVRNSRSLAISHYKMGTTWAKLAGGGRDDERFKARRHFEQARDVLQEEADAGKLDEATAGWIADFDAEAKKLK